jgi:hypothetical protein
MAIFAAMVGNLDDATDEDTASEHLVAGSPRVLAEGKERGFGGGHGGRNRTALSPGHRHLVRVR